MSIKTKDNYQLLTQAPIHKAIISMALPTMLIMLTTGLYNIADTFFMGKLSTQATAAIGVAFSMMFFMQAMGFFCGHGSGNYISRELGAKRKDHAERMASIGFLLSFSLGLSICVLGLIFLKPLCIWLGSTPTILPYTQQYLGILLLGTPFLTSSLTMNNQMRFQGNARFALWGILSGAIVNVLLDPLFIFIFQWAIMGAAMATLEGQLISFFILLWMSYKGGNLGFSIKKSKPSISYLKEIVAGGTPSLSRQGLACLAMMLLNKGAGAYGDVAIAGMSIVSRCAMMVLSLVIGFGQGFQPFCGFCYGAGLKQRVKNGFSFSVKVCFMFLLLISVAGWFFASHIIALFSKEMAVIDIGKQALQWQLLVLPLLSFTIMSNMLLQTIRKPWRANLLASARSGLFFIPLILILPRLFGLAGVEMCQAFSDLLAFLIALPIVNTTFKEFGSMA